MKPELATGLRALAEALPAGAAVPVPRELLLELLDGTAEPVQTSATPPADLTVHQVAARFGRHPSTVRLWLERGFFPGAYRFQGREWRIPVGSLAVFEARAREQGREPSSPPAAPASASLDLGDWRSARAGRPGQAKPTVRGS